MKHHGIAKWQNGCLRQIPLDVYKRRLGPKFGRVAVRTHCDDDVELPVTESREYSLQQLRRQNALRLLCTFDHEGDALG